MDILFVFPFPQSKSGAGKLGLLSQIWPAHLFFVNTVFWHIVTLIRFHAVYGCFSTTIAVIMETETAESTHFYLALYTHIRLMTSDLKHPPTFSGTYFLLLVRNSELLDIHNHFFLFNNDSLGLSNYASITTANREFSNLFFREWKVRSGGSGRRETLI